MAIVDFDYDRLTNPTAGDLVLLTTQITALSTAIANAETLLENTGETNQYQLMEQLLSDIQFATNMLYVDAQKLTEYIEFNS